MVFFTGRWFIQYPNRVVREYAIDAAGNVIHVREHNLDEKGKIKATQQINRSGKLKKQGGYLVLDLGDGRLERLWLRAGRLVVEHYDPSSRYPGQKPNFVGMGMRKR